MRTTKISDHVTQLTRSAILFPVNCFLVREDDGFTLIDTGLSGGEKGYIEAAKQLGGEIKRVALTHAHGDHIGSLTGLHAALPQAEILYTAREARIMNGDHSLDADEAQQPIRGSYASGSPQPTRAIVPGDRVGSLTVFAAPGHTPGQVAFLDERDGMLIAGDALSTYGGIAVCGIARPIFPFVKMGTWDLRTAIATAQKLCELHPQHLAVGHGRALAQPEAEMRRAIAVAERHVS